EATTLAEALSRHFRDEGLEFQPLSPRRWYLRLPAAPAMVTRAPREAAGRHVDEFLPAGPEALKWHRLMNEAQMLLHEHPVNEAREERGELPVNSVWLWGAGALPERAASSAAAVWSDEPLAGGLARLAGIPCHALPASAAEWLREAGTDAEVLAVLDELGAAARGGAPGVWRETVQALEKSWFAPLAEALRARRLARLAISCPAPERSRELVMDAGDFWKFWRAPRRLG
ncbi:MAG TPA: hypothetical protein VF104_08155, partial [Burkholderiales bacterium]